MIVALVLSAAWAGTTATCAAPLNHAALRTALDGAEQAFAALDDQAFLDRFNELTGLVLPCVDGLVSRDLAARTHRLIAIHLYGIGDERGALEALSAARGLAGGDPLPAVPLAGALAAAWEAPPAAQPTLRVPEPRSGMLAFDGMSGRDRPRESATVVQLFDGSGRPLTTTWLGPRDPLPAYSAIPRRRNLLIGLSVGTAAAATGALAGAVVTHRNLYAEAGDPSVAAERLDGLRSTTNALSVLGGVGFAVALGGGAAAWRVGPR